MRLSSGAPRVFAWVLVASCLAAASASAQDVDRTNEARSLYDAGAVAFRDGRFAAALNRWQESYELSQLPALLYNIGTAHDRLGHRREAIAAYEGYLEATPDAENANYTRSRIAILQSQLAERGGDDPGDADGGQDDRGRNGRDDADPGEDALGEDVNGEASTEADPPARNARERSIAGPIALLAGGGAALLAGVGLAIAADSQYSDLEDRCANGVCPPGSQGDIDRLVRVGRSADILMAVGGAAAVGGLVWLLVGGGEEDRTAGVRFDVGPDRITLRGAF
ncbi:MAG: tetratricopeptide repeat protein [Myxococcota bacterium]